MSIWSILEKITNPAARPLTKIVNYTVNLTKSALKLFVLLVVLVILIAGHIANKSAKLYNNYNSQGYGRIYVTVSGATKGLAELAK